MGSAYYILAFIILAIIGVILFVVGLTTGHLWMWIIGALLVAFNVWLITAYYLQASID